MGEIEKYGRYIGINKKDELEIEGNSCVDLAEKYGTPLFLVSENTIRYNYKRFYTAFQSNYPRTVTICAGMKANPGLAYRKIITQEGGGGDAFGLGELYVALLAGSDYKKIVMNGPGKPDKVLEAAIYTGININIDNLDELKRVSQIAEKLGKIANICLRIRLPLNNLEGKRYNDTRYGAEGVNIAKWEREFKFGMEPEYVFNSLKWALNKKNLNVRGLHYHGGIPRRAGYWKEEVEDLMYYVAKIKDKFSWEPTIINLGGGFTEKRYGQKEPTLIEKIAKDITSVLKTSSKEYGISLPELFLEPGRWLCADTTIYLTKIWGTKKDSVLTNKKWVYVDGSINEMADPFDPYACWHHAILANRVSAPLEEYVDICGQLCNGADILASNRKFSKVKFGEIIAFLDMGAYNEAFANQMNVMPRSMSILVNGKYNSIIRERETVQDVLSHQVLPYWLT